MTLACKEPRVRRFEPLAWPLRMAASHRGSPLYASVNGTLMARRLGLWATWP